VQKFYDVNLQQSLAKLFLQKLRRRNGTPPTLLAAFPLIDILILPLESQIFS